MQLICNSANHYSLALALFFCLVGFFVLFCFCCYYLRFQSRKRREKHQCEGNIYVKHLIGCLPHMTEPGLGLSLQLRYVSLPGIEPGTFQSGQVLYSLSQKLSRAGFILLCMQRKLYFIMYVSHIHTAIYSWL